MPKKKTASRKKQAAKKAKPAAKKKAKTKKKVAKKAGGKKRPAKKAKKAAKKSAKKAAKKTKKAARKTSGRAKKKTTKKASKKAKKVAKKTKKKAAKKSAKAKTKKQTVSKKKAEKPAKPKKIKFSVSIAPKKFVRKAAPGVLLERQASAKGAPEAAVTQEEYKLSAKELRTIRDQLIAKRETILAELRHQMNDSIARNSEQKADTLDRAADVLDGNVSYEVALAGHQELEEIEIALQKINNRTYGRCESCDGQIGSSRLKVLPSATLCANCRKLKEINGGSVDGDTIWGFPQDSDK